MGTGMEADKEIRRHLDYLAKCGLVSTVGSNGNSFTVTAAGIDVVEYNAECPPGIGRPTRV